MPVRKYVTDATLVKYYNASDIFLFPSIAEGFGLPVLEAMACGLPVITSKTTALGEIANKYAITVQPWDTDEMCKSILKITSQNKIYEKLSKLGLKRVKDFSWKKTAEEHMKFYRELI